MKSLMLMSLAATLVFTSAVAQEIEGPIKDGYQKIGVNMDTGNPEAGFIISGSAAAAMYSMMRSTPQLDECTEGQIKTDASGFNCLKHPDGDYMCSFGYDFVTQRVTNGPITC